MRFERNHYEVFGLGPSASRHEIKQRYLELVRRYHPDRSRNKAPAERLLTQINIAYQILRDAEKREAYDQGLATREVGRRDHRASTVAAGNTVVASGSEQSESKPRIDPTESLKQAHDAYMRGDRSEAQRCCEEIIRSLPGEPQALHLLGDVFADLGKRDEALTSFRAALVADPRSRMLLGKIQRTEEAIAAAARVAASRPAPAPPAPKLPPPKALTPKQAAKPPARKPLFQLSKKPR